MDYNLAKVTKGEIEYNLDQAMPYGDMPSSILMSKFEETDIELDEESYKSYARGQMTDWGPDTNKFEHEEARGGVNRSSGKLQLQYYGHRGDADSVYRPEIFDGFGGPEDHDPRGINTDPDMTKLRGQQDARMRFVRWDADGSDQVTGGGRSESQTMADQQTLIRTVRDRMKVFDRQIDGRVEGISAKYKHKSTIPKQIVVQSYGDKVPDYAENHQRRANIICKQIVRDSRKYRADCTEHDFDVARYTQSGRRVKTHNTLNLVAESQGSAEAQFAASDDTKTFKAAGLLMANIVRGKRQACTAAADMDFAKSGDTVTRKTAPFARDLNIILQSVSQDGEFKTSDRTMVGKVAAPQQLEHTARQVSYNHLSPAHHYLNAEILYKSVKPGCDLRRVKNLVVTDADTTESNTTTSGKTAKQKMISGARLQTSNDDDASDSTKTFNYKKSLAANGDKRIRLTSGEDYKTESDVTLRRRPNHTNYRAESARDTERDSKFRNNKYQNRHTGCMGSKYMTRFVDRDMRDGELAAMN